MINWFNVGDRVSSLVYGKGTVTEFILYNNEYVYKVEWDNGNVSTERYCMLKICS